MHFNRREVLAVAGAAAGMAVVPGWAGAPTPLIATTGTARLAPDPFPETPIWGYDGAVPGPVMRVQQGGRLSRRLINSLPQPTTIHWHGIRIDNAMDGVPDLTQATVPQGGSFDYGFDLPDAGTYWYHPHSRTFEQMGRGLYGALIVEEPSPPPVDADLVLLIDDWRLNEAGQLHDSFGALHDRAHAGRIGNWVTVNGVADWKRGVARGERIRLRLVNTANARVFPLFLQGMRAHVVALDGQPVDTPYAVDELILAPAQRADLIVDIDAAEGETAWLLERDREGLLAVAEFPVEGTSRADALPPPVALPPNPVPALGALDDALHVPLRMEGGAMGGLAAATRNGEERSLRDLAAEGFAWALNGSVGMEDRPLFQARLGQTVRIRMTNDTAWPHAMHVHGHHFRALGAAGPGPLRDTILLQRGETLDIAFVADNPGKWMLHCHMLEHSVAGMMTWFEVA